MSLSNNCGYTGSGKPTGRAASGSIGRKHLSGSDRIADLGGRPRVPIPAPFAAAEANHILSMLKEDNILPASEYRIVLALLKASE